MIYAIGVLCAGAAIFVIAMFFVFVCVFYASNIRTKIEAGGVEIARLDGIFSAWRYVYRSADGFEEVSRITLWGELFIFQRREDSESIYRCNKNMRMRMHHVVGADRVELCDFSQPHRFQERSLGLREIDSDPCAASLILSARRLYKEYKSKSRPIIFFASRK